MLAVVLAYSIIFFITITYIWDEKTYYEENTAFENIFMIFFYILLASVITVFGWLIADVVRFQKKSMPTFRNTAIVLLSLWLAALAFWVKIYFGF